VKRADAGESIIEKLGCLQATDDELSDEKIEALAEIICRAGDD